MSPGIRIIRIDLILGGALLLLLVLSLCGTAMTYRSTNATLHQIADLLLFEEERNLPTLLNFVLLLANMGALAVVAACGFGGRDRWRWHWLALSAGFLLLAYDEAAQVHEGLNKLVGSVVETGGFLAFAWVIPGAAVVVVLAIAFSRFLLALPRRSTALFVLSAAIYLGGALGVEMIGARLWAAQGWDNVAYSLLATLEETLEMGGLIVFLHAVLMFLAGPGGTLQLEVQCSEGRSLSTRR
ncbi:hypothetical protein QCN27_14625 [Cereibacter sp. SYSU M97828]|nr:hypothetical protein [Cereibacter flavus]